MPNNPFHSLTCERIISELEHRFLRGPDSQEAHRIISTLRDAGFVAYLAGGCVRDALLGKPPKDYDVATDATPNAIRNVFGKSKTLAFGASFGVIGVLPPRSQSNSGLEPTEVATFRSDGYYSDGRRPDSVHFGDAKHDAMRRDFTINGLFYDPGTDEVIDFVGGEDDLKAGILRTIGNPLERFGEDKLRMLRAVRFATTLGFQIDEATNRAINEHADDIAVVSGERIGAEMRRVLVSEHAVAGLRHLQTCGLQRVVLPELEHADLPRLETLIHHRSDQSFPLTLGLLLMVVDDPQTTLRAIAKRWRLSNEEVRVVNAALKHWPTIAEADSLPWSVVQPILIDRDVTAIVQTATAMIAEGDQDDAGLRRVNEALSWPEEKLNPPPLISGDDLRDMGIPAGPHYKTTLQAIRNAQLDGKIDSREEAIEMAR